MDKYQILKLPRDATQEEIREAYLAEARRLNPDRNPTAPAREQYRAVQEAYSTLSDPSKRIIYNQSLPPPPPPAQVQTSVILSKNQLVKSAEPQLLYALIRISTPVELDKSLLPPAHVVLVIDRSTSMQGERMEMVKLYSGQLLRMLKPQDLLSVVVFSDRAEILIPPTPASDLNKVTSRLSQIKPGGGTELARGLQAGVDLLAFPMGFKAVKQLILLTDGHTYGDESACISLAEKSLLADVTIHCLGIGDMWNDALLDEIALKTGGIATFIQSAKDLQKFFEKTATGLLLLYARGLRFDYYLNPDVDLRYAFKIYPDSYMLGRQASLMLGDLFYNNHIDFILELLVRDLSHCSEDLDVLKGKVWMDLVGRDDGIVRQYINISIPVSQSLLADAPPEEIINAMARISLYRLQEKARKDVGEGNIDLATRRLEYLATNLMAVGNRNLAQTVLFEADNIRKNHAFSKDGDKKIKYGTRALLLDQKKEQDKQ